MYQMNEMELWNGRRHELVHETQDGRLARSLRTARPKRVHLFWSALFGRAPVGLSAHGSGRA